MQLPWDHGVAGDWHVLGCRPAAGGRTRAYDAYHAQRGDGARRSPYGARPSWYAPPPANSDDSEGDEFSSDYFNNYAY